MPPNVARFEQLMYLSLGISVVAVSLDYRPSQLSPLGGVLIPLVEAILFVISILLIWQAARRHANWARWVLLILFVVAVPLQIAFLNETLKNSLVAGVLEVVSFFLQGVALYLVFTGNATPWFKKADSSWLKS